MIQHFKVEGLNNQFDYEFEFNEDLNIFTGANGCGKTTLLKLIWYLISGNLHRVTDEIPFKSFSIETDQFSLSIERFKHKSTPRHGVNGERRRGGREGSTKPKIRISWKPRGGKEMEFPNINVSGFRTKGPVIDLNKKIASLEQDSLFFPTFRRIEGGFSIDFVNAGNTEEQAVISLLSSPAAMLQAAMSKFSEELSTDRHKFITSVSTKDIEELLPLKQIEISNKVNELYAELSDRIGKEVSSSDALQSNQAISALEHIQEDLLETSKTRQKLENRMTVLDETVQIIFGRDIQVTEGIRLGKKNETYSKETAIHTDKLSSGEKQMLGFLCYNAFSDNTAIFIDEPELSLHQDWQDILLPLLLKQETGNQFFVATHSEFIYEQFPDKEHILNLEGN